MAGLVTPGDKLRRDGVARVTDFDMTGSLAAAARRYHFATCPMYQGAHTVHHSDKRPVPWVDVTAEVSCATQEDTLRAPGLLELGFLVWPVVYDYLGAEARLYSANAFWTRPGAHVRPDIQEFHTDPDDTRFVALFVYLTDVLKPEDGAHQIKDRFGGVHTVLGPAGTAFLADTSQPHRGIKPTTGERGIAWLRWGVSNPPAAYIWEDLKPSRDPRIAARIPAEFRSRCSLVVES